MRKSLTETLAADGRTTLDYNIWNSLLRAIDAALAELQTIKISWDALTADATTLALQRINDAILPAAQQIRAISSLGFLTAGSSTEVTLVAGEVAQFILSNDGRPELFAPTKWVVISRLANPDDIAIGTVAYFDRETRQFEVTIEAVLGSSGPFSDWEFSGQAGVVEAQRLLYEDTKAHAEDVAEKAGDVTTKHATVTSNYAAFTEMWKGGLYAAPVGAAPGAAYVDRSQTPNVVKVLTDDGWAPAVSTSIGGSRSQDYPAAEGGETSFAVDGGFSVGDVYRNGELQRAGVGVTFSPGDGEFTLSTPLSEGDLVSFRGYLANDAVDIYTKSETNALLGERLSVSGEAQVVPPEGRRVAVNSLGLGAAFRQNPLINGDFFVSQTGDMPPIAGNPRTSVDRWCYNHVGGTLQITREALSIGDTMGYGAGERFLRMSVEGKTAGSSDIYQRIEGVGSITGPVTVMGWARRTGGAGPFSVRLAQEFGSGGSATVFALAPRQTAGTGWTPFAVTFTLPSVAGKLLGATPSNIVVQIFASSDVDATTDGPTGIVNGPLDLYGLHIRPGFWDVGAVSWYSPPDPALEIMRCKRFYERIGAGTSIRPQICLMEVQTANAAVGLLNYTRKRSTPDVRFSPTSDFRAIGNQTSWAPTSLSAEDVGLQSCLIVFASSSMIPGNSLLLQRIDNPSASGFVDIDAEI